MGASQKITTEQKQRIAFRLYQQGESQKNIAEIIGTTEKTLSSWVEKGQWEIKRASQAMTRSELVKKLMVSIDTMITKINEEGDLEMMLTLPEKLSGFANIIGKLDKKDNIIDLIETFEGFNSWLELKALKDKRLTPEILRLISEYQEKYVDEIALKIKQV
jgi:transposase-like protein